MRDASAIDREPWKIVAARSAQQRGSAGARIEEVVTTNTVAGERIRVAESKSDGPPLVAAVGARYQWPRSFPLICEARHYTVLVMKKNYVTPCRSGVR